MHRYICEAYIKYAKCVGSGRLFSADSFSVETPGLYDPKCLKRHRFESTPQTGHNYKRIFSPTITPVVIKDEDVPFALCEDRRIRRGVLKFGPSNWETIYKQYLFAPARSAKGLEKRWKQLEEQDYQF